MRFGASTFIFVSPFGNDTLDLIDHVARMGFDLIEICVEDPRTIDPPRIRERLDRAGIGATVCGAFGPDRDMSADDPAVRAQALGYLKQCVDIAAALGATRVVGPMYSAVGRTRLAEDAERQAQRDLAARGIREAADHAGSFGVELGIEPLNRFETDLVNTVDQGLDLLERIERPNVGLLLDTFHMNIEEKSIPAAIRRAEGRITQFHACGSDRGTPGEDHLPWAEIAEALGDAGFSGPVVIEAFNPNIREIARAVCLWRPLAEGPDRLAENGLAHLRRIFRK
ncbi:MAG: sugar phosphate isomerase/epimerase [Mesorhizobium amorphae]|nr:MAG: sugar phosphate isomerase/epimerase [Mesorhizobium amorphae]